MNIAVFGDIHGEISKLTESCLEFQRQTDKTLDYALQVGDLGIYGEKTPEQYIGSLKYPEEWELQNMLDTGEVWKAFHPEYLQNNPPQDIEIPPLYFVDGNHDDTKYIRQKGTDKENTIELHDKLQYIKRGNQVKLEKKGEELKISGLGGITKEERPSQYERNNDIAFSTEECDNCLFHHDSDILLTHMPPFDKKETREGSHDIDEVVHYTEPEMHFFGHHGDYFEFMNGATKTFGLRRIKYSHTKNMEAKEGSMKMLGYDGSRLSVMED